jgi:hypothetical protein
MPYDLKAGIAWIKSHPWETGGLVFVIGVGAFFLLGRGGQSNAQGGPDANLAAYLQAETAQNQSDNALTALQSQVSASTEQARIAANENISVNNTWAASDLAQTQANNAAGTQNKLIDYFGQLANNLGTVLTNSSSSSSGSGGSLGFNLFGLGFGGSTSSQSASSHSSQTLVANTQQAAAEHELEQIASTQFHAYS